MDRSVLVAWVALLGSSGAAHPSSPAPQEPGLARTVEAEPAATIARELVATFDAQARQTALLPYAAPDRRVWRRDPSPRPGLAVADMTALQRALAERLLRSVLSEEGALAVAGIRAEQDLLAVGEDGLGTGFYWLALYGDPGSGAWSWRFGGHHVSVHATYDGERIRSVSPLMLGGEQEDERSEAWQGYARLRERDRLVREIAALVASVPPEERRSASAAPQSMEWSEPRMRPLSDEAPGMLVASLPERGQELVAQLVAEHASAFRRDLAAALVAGFERAAARLAVSDPAEDRVLYLRIHSPKLLIETSNSGRHLHTLLRTDADFGGWDR